MAEKNTERVDAAVQHSALTIRITVQTAWKLLIAAVYVLLFVGFVLQICGVAVAHHKCMRYEHAARCHDQMRQHWWVMFFELIVAGSTGVAMYYGTLKDVILAVLVFLAMVTVKLMDSAESFMHFNRNMSDSRWDHQSKSDATRTAAAGYVISSIGNFLLIFLVGISKGRIMEWISSVLEWRRDSWSPDKRTLSKVAFGSSTKDVSEEVMLIQDDQTNGLLFARRAPATQTPLSESEAAEV